MVSPDLDQKIDVVGLQENCAYEFNVSGKNAWAEFYKDIVKVIIWNEKGKGKLTQLVFVTEETEGHRFLDAPMPRAYITLLRAQGLSVCVVYVNHQSSAQQ